MGGPSVVGLTVGACLQLQGVPVFPWQQAQPPYGEGLNCSSVPRSKPPALWGPRRPRPGRPCSLRSRSRRRAGSQDGLSSPACLLSSPNPHTFSKEEEGREKKDASFCKMMSRE